MPAVDHSEVGEILADLKAQLEQLNALQAELSSLFEHPGGPEQLHMLDTLLKQTNQLNLQLVETETRRLKWLQKTGETEMLTAFAHQLDEQAHAQALKTWEETRTLLPGLNQLMKVNRATLNRLDHFFEDRINMLFGDNEAQRNVYGASGMTRGNDRSRSIGEA